MKRFLTKEQMNKCEIDTCLFAGDLESGGLLLICAFCDRKIEVHDDTEECPVCKNDLVFSPYGYW